MGRWIIAAIVLALASGCEQPPFPQAKVEAESRWTQSRAQVLCRIAENRLAAGQLDRAFQAAQQAVTLDEELRPARLVLAKVQIERGRYAAAIRALEKVIKADPKSAEAIYLLGVAQEKNGRLEEALASYRRAYALDEANLAAVKAAAEVLVALGQPRRAQIYVESYLPKADQDAGMYELAGRLAMMSKEYAKATDHYQHARDLDYKNLRYQEALGRAQYFTGQYGHALDTLEELARCKDYSAPTWLRMMVGDCYLAVGKPRRAFEAYYQASEQSPEVARVWGSLAKSALAMRDNARAILAARKALQQETDQLDALLVLGYALIREGQAAAAVETLKRATAAHPRSSTARCLLGRAHAAAGNHAESVRCYTAALQIDPQNRMARELLSAATGKELSRLD